MYYTQELCTEMSNLFQTDTFQANEDNLPRILWVRGVPMDFGMLGYPKWMGSNMYAPTDDWVKPIPAIT